MPHASVRRASVRRASVQRASRRGARSDKAGGGNRPAPGAAAGLPRPRVKSSRRSRVCSRNPPIFHQKRRAEFARSRAAMMPDDQTAVKNATVPRFSSRQRSRAFPRLCDSDRQNYRLGKNYGGICLRQSATVRGLTKRDATRPTIFHRRYFCYAGRGDFRLGRSRQPAHAGVISNGRSQGGRCAGGLGPSEPAGLGPDRYKRRCARAVGDRHSAPNRGVRRRRPRATCHGTTTSREPCRQ